MFNWFQGFWNWLKSYFDAFLGRIGQFWDWIGTWFADLAETFGRFWEWIEAQIDKAWEAISHLAEYVTALILALIEAAWLFFLDAVSFVLDTLGDLAIWALNLLPIDPADWDLNSRLGGLGATVIEILFAVGFHTAIAIYVAAILLRLTINLLSGIIPFLRA